MTIRARRRWRALAGLTAAVCALAAAPATAADEALRVSGAITKDATWSGAVYLTGPTQVRDATVTVSPGTTIEFVGSSGAATIELAAGIEGDAGQIVFAGTPESPIVVRARPEHGRGTVEVQVRADRRLSWRHVRFEGLGYQKTVAFEEKEAVRHEPAVAIVADPSKPTGIELDSCEFVGGSRLFVRCGSETTGRVAGCAFREGAERLDFELSGVGGGAMEVARCRFGGVVDVLGAPVAFRENVLIGERTALAINGPTSQAARIEGNYIHNTATEDDGRYCLKCRDPDAEVRDNVLRGGSYVVLEGSRRMRGNVLIAAPRLASRVVKSARTHYLVAELPARARFEENLLIGPAYALLATQAAHRGKGAGDSMAEAISGIVIRRNVFDGLGGTGQAIRLNMLAREPVGATIRENVFLRVDTVVMDESRREGVVAYVDQNVIAPRPARIWDGVTMGERKPGQAGFGAEDRVFETLADAGLAGPLAGPPDDWDSDVISGRRTAASIREMLFAAYRRR